MSGVVHLRNIMTDENENGTQEFNSVMTRVFNALDVARRDLAAQRNDNVLRVTRSTFRRRRRAPTMGISVIKCALALSMSYCADALVLNHI